MPNVFSLDGQVALVLGGLERHRARRSHWASTMPVPVVVPVGTTAAKVAEVERGAGAQGRDGERLLRRRDATLRS